MIRGRSRRAWGHWRVASALSMAIIPSGVGIAPHAVQLAQSSVTPLRPAMTINPVKTATESTDYLAGSLGTREVPSTRALATAVGIERCTFIDKTRSVMNYATSPATIRSTHRTLLTEIRYPTSVLTKDSNDSYDAAPLAHRGGYPLILFAHGYDVSPDTYAALLDDWARAGFVVIAPFFPDEKYSAVTAQHGADTEGDLVNEPADVAFVARQVIDDSRAFSPGCPIVHALVNPSHIALAGQSDGANAIATLTYEQGLDPQGVPFARLDQGLHIQAIVILSGQEAPARSYAAPASSPPLLMVQSRQDQCNSIRSAVMLYRDVHQVDKWFLELQTAHHLPPYDGVDKPAFRIVVATTVHFFTTSLQVARLSTSLFAFANHAPTLAQMFDDQSGPPLTNLPVFTGVCGLT